jgi:predicted CXXCH cytochrome family protein
MPAPPAPESMFQPKRLLLLAAIIVLVAGIAWGLILRWTPPLPAASFAGSEACAACHAEAFSLWQQSHHRHAMEAADAGSVLGDFRDATFDYFGTTSRFFTRDGQYFVHTDNARGVMETFRIAYTFGYHPLQQYLVEFPDGRMQALGLAWDSRTRAEGGQRWFALYGDRKVTHEDPLHWTGALQNWNSQCAACHSTGIVKGYRREDNRYDTRWKEISVGCEACHGPGSRHVEWANGARRQGDKGLTADLRKAWESTVGARPVAQPAGAAMSAQMQACAACHSRRSELQPTDAAAGFLDNFALSPLQEHLYFDDGQMRDEVYETGSFLQSRMHNNQVACTNCHEPHSSRLRISGNGLCLQCHEPRQFQTPAHFFHEPDSTGAQCVNCHMPQRTYMGVDVRHDHSLRIPDPVASVRHGVPNACTQCHANRDDHWAAEFLAKRTGRREPRYPHAAFLAGARRGDATVVPELLALARDAGQAPALRAIALQESGRFGGSSQVDAAVATMGERDPLLRAAAAASLGQLDPVQRLTRLASLLADPVKSVRIAAARALIELHPERAPESLRPALRRSFDEYQASLLHNADMPAAMTELASFQAAQGDLDGAEQSLLQARRLSPRFLTAMLNLADVQRARGRDDEGELLLREALAAWPESGDVYHALGLLYVRTGRTPQAVELFRQAVVLAPDNARHALVHALALIETGRRAEGLAALQRAARRFPADVQIRQAWEGYRLPQP